MVRGISDWVFIAALHLLLIVALPVRADEQVQRKNIVWESDYHVCLDAAEAAGKLALLWFYDPLNPKVNQVLANEVFAEDSIATEVEQRFVAAKLPTGAMAVYGGENTVLLDHPAFAEMRQAPGLAIVDMTEETSPLFRQVVSVYPLAGGSNSLAKMRTLLDLPRGTLTQRTLIFAVRTHLEQPASTRGHFSQLLSGEAESHAGHQAHITLQGHHNWESRFHKINALLPGGLVAREVCAESWPGQTLMEAAEECVHSWRQSPGHWEAVSSRHELFGYDMKLGRNGVWYATGIFAGR